MLRERQRPCRPSTAARGAPIRAPCSRTSSLGGSAPPSARAYQIRRGSKLVGEDEAGNSYYETIDRRFDYDGRNRRFVIYNGYADASKVPADWHGWLHHTFDEPPTRRTAAAAVVGEGSPAQPDRHDLGLAAEGLDRPGRRPRRRPATTRRGPRNRSGRSPGRHSRPGLADRRALRGPGRRAAVWAARRDRARWGRAPAAGAPSPPPPARVTRAHTGDRPHPTRRRPRR